MNDLFKTLSDLLKGAGSGSKAVAGLVAVAILVAIGAMATVSNRPHFELAFSGLSDHEVAKVNKALSEVGIAFETSQPPGPFVVYVDDKDRSAAYNAVYGAGALDKPLKGILSSSGMESVFQGSEERLQSVRKREWEEMEGMLELLDFVASARVRTAPGKTSPLAGIAAPAATASVTLRLLRPALEPGQAQTVATLVSRGLGIAKKDLVISDQAGNSLFDGTDAPSELDRDAKGTLAHQLEHDRRATDEANELLAEILGPNKARVSVRSEWNWDRSTTHTETPSGKGALVSESKTSSETPVGGDLGAGGASGSGGGTGGAGGVPGISSNLAGSAPGDASREAESSAPPVVSTRSEETRQYEPTIATEERVRFAPELKRLSVAVYLDDSIDEALVASLEQTIKTSVGFSEARDVFDSVRVPFILDEPALQTEGEEGAPATEEAPAEPNPLVEQLLERGVEILAAAVFIGLLLKSLKSGSKTITPAAAKRKERTPGLAGAAASTTTEDEIDPELLARIQVEELLKQDPERVGEILTSWALADEAGVAKR